MNNSIIIGIDFSIKNASYCISDFNTFKFGSVVSDYKFTKNKLKLLEDLDSLDDSNIKIVEEEKREFTSYYAEQQHKLVRYSNNISSLIELIKKENLINKNVICSIEGISYGAKGNALIDIAISTGILRYRILSEILNNNSSRLFIFSPAEFKNAIHCKGNDDKIAIFNKFIEDPILEPIKNTSFYKFIINNIDRIKKEKQIESPFNDIIDSYLGVLTIHKSLKNNET